MPYRGALETTLARCAALQERIRGMERTLGLPWTAPVEIVAETYDEACELERRLGARLYELEEEMAQRRVEETGTATVGVAHAQQQETVRESLTVFYVAVVAALLIIAAIGVEVMRKRSVHRTHDSSETVSVEITEWH